MFVLEHVAVLREKARRLPLEPGVYLMRDAGGEIIYVGKAKALRNRVSSYFRSLEKHQEKVRRMVYSARDFEVIVTAGEFEALVLECSMIKQYKPRYNILLKDDKGYHYMRISQEEYPRITAEKQIAPGDNAKYLGPFISSFVVSQTADEVNKVFMLPTCKLRFPEDFGKSRPCLNYHIKQCIGLCRGKITPVQYREIIAQALEFISGGSEKTAETLTRKMEAAAEALEFEKAAELRDRIKAISRISAHQHVVFTKTEDADIISLVQNADECCAAILKIRAQRLVDKQTFMLGEIESLESARRQFLLSYYNASAAEIAPAVMLDGPCEDDELVSRYLCEKRNRKVSLLFPSRGEGARLVQMASANAAQQLSQSVGRTGRELAALDELARLLGLRRTPVYIEAYDISNYGGDTVVGGMVVFENGRPLRSAYKRFNIGTVDGVDDYAAMREMISRRFARYDMEREESKADADEGEKGETGSESGFGFGRLPDLVLLDGGRGHVGAVEPILREMGIEVPVFGMVKDSTHRTRAIAQGGGEISIAASRSAFALVSKIQDEVHRYSITMMKRKHKKSTISLKLTQVPGIGEKRAAALLKHFKTGKALGEAGVTEIAAVAGMSEKSAQAVFEFLHPL